MRPDIAHSILVLGGGRRFLGCSGGGGRSIGCCLDGGSAEAENHVCPSSDSDYDEDEPRKFYVHIKPVQPREADGSAEATMEQLKATVGNLILPPGIGVSLQAGELVGGEAAGSPGTVSGLTDPLSPFSLQGTVKRQSSRKCHPGGSSVPRAPCPLMLPVPVPPQGTWHL